MVIDDEITARAAYLFVEPVEPRAQQGVRERQVRDTGVFGGFHGGGNVIGDWGFVIRIFILDHYNAIDYNSIFE